MSHTWRQIKAHRRKSPRLDSVKEILKDNTILTFLEARDKCFINAENDSLCEEGGNFTHFRSKSIGSSNSSLCSVLDCVLPQTSLEGSYFNTLSVSSSDSLSSPTRSCKRRRTIDEDDDTFHKLHRCRNERIYELNREFYFEDEVHYKDKQCDYYQKYAEEERNLQQVRSWETRKFVETLNDNPQCKCQKNHGQKRKASEANSEDLDIFRHRGERSAVFRSCSDLSADISTQDVSAGSSMDIEQ